jgi:hypothetical protein
LANVVKKERDQIVSKDFSMAGTGTAQVNYGKAGRRECITLCGYFPARTQSILV